MSLSNGWTKYFCKKDSYLNYWTVKNLQQNYGHWNVLEFHKICGEIIMEKDSYKKILQFPKNLKIERN